MVLGAGPYVEIPGVGPVPPPDLRKPVFQLLLKKNSVVPVAMTERASSSSIAVVPAGMAEWARQRGQRLKAQVNDAWPKPAVSCEWHETIPPPGLENHFTRKNSAAATNLEQGSKGLASKSVARARPGVSHGHWSLEPR